MPPHADASWECAYVCDRLHVREKEKNETRKPRARKGVSVCSNVASKLTSRPFSGIN